MTNYSFINVYIYLNMPGRRIIQRYIYIYFFYCFNLIELSSNRKIVIICIDGLRWCSHSTPFFWQLELLRIFLTCKQQVIVKW